MTWKSFFTPRNGSGKAKKMWFMTRGKANEVEDEKYPLTDIVYS